MLSRTTRSKCEFAQYSGAVHIQLCARPTDLPPLTNHTYYVCGKVAREYGDLSENAEYDAAKEEQAMIEARIKELEAKLSNYEIIDESKIRNDIVSIGSFVKVLDKEFDEEEVYQIVGSTEADINLNRISNNSPMATALLGKKKGDTVRVATPQATFEVTILEISKDKIN